MTQSWIIVRDEKPSFPWRQPTWQSRIAVDENERIQYLILKIDEEMQEVLRAATDDDTEWVIEELWDVYEIIISLNRSWDEFCVQTPAIQSVIDTYNLTNDHVKDAAEKKRKTHGSFSKGILLDTNTVKK